MEEITRGRYQEYFRLNGNETMIKATVGGNMLFQKTQKKKSLRKIQHPILTFKKNLQKHKYRRELPQPERVIFTEPITGVMNNSEKLSVRSEIRNNVLCYHLHPTLW